MFVHIFRFEDGSVCIGKDYLYRYKQRYYYKFCFFSIWISMKFDLFCFYKIQILMQMIFLKNYIYIKLNHMTKTKSPFSVLRMAGVIFNLGFSNRSLRYWGFFAAQMPYLFSYQFALLDRNLYSWNLLRSLSWFKNRMLLSLGFLWPSFSTSFLPFSTLVISSLFLHPNIPFTWSCYLSSVWLIGKFLGLTEFCSYNWEDNH